MGRKVKELPPLREEPAYYDAIEAEILKVFRREIYLPLLRELSKKEKLGNADEQDPLARAIASGRIRFHQGKFRGKFDAATSRALKELGATWDRREKGWNLVQAKLPPSIRTSIQASEYRFDRVAAAIDKKLAELLPAKIAENVKLAKLFDRTLWSVDQKFESQVKAITIVPKLTPETRAKVAEGYTQDLQRYIQDFTGDEIGKLRESIQKSGTAGNRYETMVEKIKTSYGVSQRKAKFLARQETGLMMTSFKKARYQEAGINEYRWQCVIGSPKHPVRPMHQALNGKIFSWDKPPVTDNKGSRNHPGEDFGCRCVARPIVKF